MYVVFALLIVCTMALAIVAIRARRHGVVLSEKLVATKSHLQVQAEEHGRVQALLSDLRSAEQDLRAKRQALEESLRKTEAELSGTLAAKQQTTLAARKLESTLRAEYQRILTDLEATQRQLDAHKESERNAVSERDKARARSVEAQRAQKAAEEEARQSRTAKESYAIEVKLLREELRHTELQLEQALKAAQDLPTTAEGESEASDDAGTYTTVRVTTWWCQACGCGGTKPKKCCSDETKVKPGTLSQHPNK